MTLKQEREMQEEREREKVRNVNGNAASFTYLMSQKEAHTFFTKRSHKKSYFFSSPATKRGEGGKVRTWPLFLKL